MALQIDCPSKTGGTQEKAYMIVDLTLDNKTKRGRIELATWKDESARKAGSQKINNICISVGADEVWFVKSEDAEDKWPTYKVGDNIYIAQLAFDDFMWKTGDEIYKKLKTLKINVDNQIIDLSKGEDV